MKRELEELDDHLQRTRPGYYNQLQPPLSQDDIVNLEHYYHIQLPLDLKSLYNWKNGQEDSCYESFVNNSMFEPLETVLEGQKELSEMIGYDFTIENWWNRNWLPIFSKGSGSYICYDIEGTFTGQPGQLIEFWKTDNDRPVISPNLSKLIQILNQYYDETPKEDFDGYLNISKRMSNWKQIFNVNQSIQH